MKIKPLLTTELMALDVQEWQRKPEFELSVGYCEFLVQNSLLPSGIWHDGRLVAAGGAFEVWEGRAEVWMLLAKDAGKNFTGVHRMVKRFLDLMPHARLETTCEVGWPEAERWLKMLGFEHERLARKYMPGGRDVHIYVRIR